MTPWPCTTCGAPGRRNLGVRGYCATHLADLYAGFAPEVFAYAGVAVPCGVVRPEYGPAVADVRCNACGATWAGLAGDPCGWCQRAWQVMVEHQAELTLTPPDVDPADARRDDMLQGWATRLWVAVEAGIIDQQQAERALQREANRAAA